jgi:uncharacterized protein (TIGR02099 family)
MSFGLRKPLKWLLGGLAAVIVVIGLLFATFGYVVGRVPEYRVQLQDWLNERTGLAVEFRSLRARLRIYGPELIFNDAVVRTPDRTRVLATARRGSVAFDLWNSIRTGRLTAGRFSLLSPEIGLIRTREGKIQLLGQSALPERRDTPFAIEQLPTGRFHVEKAVVSFRDEITGRGPWSLSGVSFDLTRDPKSLRLRGDASLPKALGRGLEFTATVEGALEESAQLVSSFSVEGKTIDLAGWADVLPDEWPVPENGHGALRVDGAMHGAALMQISAKVAFVDVAAVLPAWATPLPKADPMQQPSGDEEEAHKPKFPIESAAEAVAAAPALPEMVSYSRVAFDLRGQKLGDAWSLSVSDLHLTRKESAWRSKQISAKWSRPQGEGASAGLKLSGKADRIELAALWPLLAYLPESEQLARLRALNASGTIENLAVDYERAAQAASPAYSLQAKLDRIAFRPVAKGPGLAGLNGQVRATDRGGEFQLAARDARFELPRIFRDVLTLQSIDGSIKWQRVNDTLTIQGDNVRVRNEDGRGEARFIATIPGGDSSPVLDLSVHAQDLKVGSAHKYLPAGRLSAKTMEWFDRALVDGRVVTADVTYKGPMRAFPFRHDEGTFLARGHVEKAVLDYQADWMPAQEIVADLEFRNEGMRIRATSAAVGELHVENAIADIADFGKSRLVIDAAASGDLGYGLQFLKGSPLGPKLGEQFARLSGQGGLKASLRLDLPLKHLAEHDVKVAAQLADATVSMQGIDPAVKKLNGSLTVRNATIAAAQLQGLWLGGVLDVAVGPEGAVASMLNARGRASAAQLKPLLGLPSTLNVSGATDWHMAADITDGPPRVVRIDSTLQGLGVALPEPVGKREAEVSPLTLMLEFADDTLLTRGSLGNVRSLVRLRRSADGWGLDRGGLRADGIAPALPNHRGLRIEGTLDHFVLDEWLALRGTGASAAGNANGKSLSDYLQAANVRIGTFELYGYRWPDVRGILQSTSAGWRVDVSGANAAGQILIPENFTGALPLRATLEHLVIEKKPDAPGTDKDDAQSITDPRNFPNMQLHIGDLRLGKRAVGAVELKASRVEQGIRFDTVTVSGESSRGEGRGQWLITPQGPQSSLSATVSSSNVASTLRSLDYTEFAEAKRGEIRADLNWPGGFNDNMLEHASGGIAVDAEGGQLVNLQPGAGRVLGLFSVAALPRRLALDFSDLTEKGLAFDTVHGDFELRDGNAYTSNLTLRGPAAEIGIVGRTGLATRDYDQTAVVTGNLGVSVPVAGALAGGPVVGAALLLFSQVFKEPLKGITRGYYRITGPWDDPIVERVDASAAKAEAAGE